MKLALLAAILLAARVLWLMQHREDVDTPPFLVLLLLGELPLFVAGIFTLTRKGENVARGAGLACAAALSYTVLAVPLFVDVAVSSGWQHGYRNVNALEKCIPISVASAVWLLISAFLLRVRGRTRFWRFFGVGIAYVVPACLAMSAAQVRGSRYVNEKAAYEDPFQGPLPPVRQLTACLIRHHFLQPNQQYPNSLNEIAPDWNCDEALTNAQSFSPYWIFYSHSKDPNGAPDFSIEAIPQERNHLGSDPLTIDARGELIRFTGLGLSAGQRRKTYGPLFAVRTEDASHEGAGQWLFNLRHKIDAFVRDHDSTPPISLQEVLDKKEAARFKCSGTPPNPTQIQIGTKWEHPCYVISYVLPSNKGPRTFSVSLQCMNYGNGCIRSFLLDPDSVVHATSEPRRATERDPGLLPCEMAAPCKDAIWTPARSPAEWMFVVARIHYFIKSTNWW